MENTYRVKKASGTKKPPTKAVGGWGILKGWFG